MRLSLPPPPFVSIRLSPPAHPTYPFLDQVQAAPDRNSTCVFLSISVSARPSTPFNPYQCQTKPHPTISGQVQAASDRRAVQAQGRIGPQPISGRRRCSRAVRRPPLAGRAHSVRHTGAAILVTRGVANFGGARQERGGGGGTPEQPAVQPCPAGAFPPRARIHCADLSIRNEGWGWGGMLPSNTLYTLLLQARFHPRGL